MCLSDVCSTTSTVDGDSTATIASSALSDSVACVVYVEGGQLLKSFVFLVTILLSEVLSAVTMLPFF